MTYRLPRFQDTYLVLAGGEVHLYEERNGLDFCIHTQKETTWTHRQIWQRHRALVLRFRRLQLAWKLGGKHIPMFRRMILCAMESGRYPGIGGVSRNRSITIATRARLIWGNYNSYDDAAHRASLRLQDEVVRRLQAEGVSAKIESPGYIWLPTHKKSFVHWHRESLWRDEKGAPLGETNHLNAAEVADAISKILAK
ncbi:MAG: hypothetical protein WA785_20955 [Candidatus Acidiferrales bacterium]